MKKIKNTSFIVENRRARFDYDLKDELSVGMSLSGLQVRKIRDNHVQLKGAFVTIKNGELWLNNLTIETAVAPNIRLLATRKQIEMLARGKESGLTIVPVRLFPHNRYIKLEIALAQGKKKYDKRQTIKSRDLDREGKKFRY